jgi:hypothetical protein
MSSSAFKRRSMVTASARSLPVLTYSSDDEGFRDRGVEISTAALRSGIPRKMTEDGPPSKALHESEHSVGRALVNGCLHSGLALVQIDDTLSFHVEFSVSRIVRHFFPGEVELLICVL